MSTPNNAKIDFAAVAALVLDIIGASFLAAKLRNSGGEEINATYVKNHARYVAMFHVNALANAATAFAWRTAEDVTACMQRLVVNPHTGKQVNLYSLEKAGQWLQAWSGGKFMPTFADKYTLAILASMSQNGYAMNTRNMQAACSTHVKAKAGDSFKLRIRLHKGATTASTQVSSSCNVLHALGFAHYDGHTLTVRESDKFTRKAIAALDAMETSALEQIVGQCASSTYENGRA